MHPLQTQYIWGQPDDAALKIFMLTYCCIIEDPWLSGCKPLHSSTNDETSCKHNGSGLCRADTDSHHLTVNGPQMKRTSLHTSAHQTSYLQALWCSHWGCCRMPSRECGCSADGADTQAAQSYPHPQHGGDTVYQTLWLSLPSTGRERPRGEVRWS